MNDNQYYTHGSAKWAEAWEIKKSKLLGFKPQSLFAGFSPYHNKGLFIPGDGHMTVTGGAGSGKGAGLLAYLILGKTGWDSSAIINDLRADLIAICMHFLHERGIEAISFNPYGLFPDKPWFLPQHRINPLEILSPDSATLTPDIKAIMEMLIISAAKDDYFDMKAKQWPGAFLKFLVLTLGKIKKITLPDLYQFINMMETEPETFASIAKHEMMTTGDEEIKRTVSEILYKRQSAEREYGSIVGTIYKNFSWMDDTLIQEALSGSDYSLESLLNGHTYIFLNIPAEYSKNLAPLQRLMFGSAMLLKYRNPDAPRLLALVDEAGQLGYFPMLQQAYDYGRGAGIRVCGVFQTLAQMNVYPSRAQGILGSSQTRIHLGTRDLESANYISSMIGDQTLEYDDLRVQADAGRAKTAAIHKMLFGNDPYAAALDIAHYKNHEIRKSKMRRRLIMSEEVLSLSDDRMISLTSGFDLPPVLARKINHFQCNGLKYMPSPYHPPYDRVGKGLLGKKRVVSEEVPEHLCHYPQFQKGYLSKLV